MFLRARKLLEIKSYSLIFVQEIITEILARGLLPDIRGSGYGEWTFFFTDYLASLILNNCEIFIYA